MQLVLEAGHPLLSTLMKPCVCFGMVSSFSSIFRMPVTSVVIMFELAGVISFTLIIPIILCSYISINLSNRLFHPLIDTMLAQDGVNLVELRNTASLEPAEADWATTEDTTFMEKMADQLNPDLLMSMQLQPIRRATSGASESSTSRFSTARSSMGGFGSGGDTQMAMTRMKSAPAPKHKRISE